MILLQYIQDVLFRQHTCTVPEIGTFTLQFLPARYNTSDRSLDPPGQQVLFNEQWTDDGSCLEWISLKENLVPAVAQLKLNRYIAEMKAALESRQPLALPGLGTLQTDALGHIDFYPENLPGKPDTLHLQPVYRPDAPSWQSPAYEPPPQPAYTPPAYTPPAYTPPTPASTPAPEPVQQHYEAPVPTPAPEPVAAAHTPQEPVVYPPAPWELEEQQSRFKWWWIAIPIAAALLATGIWWFIDNQSYGGGTATLDMDAIPPTPQDTMSMVPETTPTDTSAAMPAATDTLQYYVVFATYPSRAAAEKRFRQLKGFGLNVAMYNTRDSTNFKLAMPFRSLAADTAANIKKVRDNYGGKNGKVYLEF